MKAEGRASHKINAPTAPRYPEPQEDNSDMWQKLATKLREKWFGEDLGEAKPLFSIVDELMPRNELLLAMLPGRWNSMFRGPS